MKLFHSMFFFSMLIISITFLVCPKTAVKETLSEVIQTLTKDAYFPVDVEQATIKALDAFSRTTDKYSRFLGPDDYKDLLTTTAGGYYGIGLELAPKKEDDEVLVVLHVKQEGPAYKAGIKQYDKIIAIDSTPVGPLSLDECLKKLRRETQYSPVALTLLRDTKPFTITIKRDSLSMNSSWAAYLPEQKIVYCHISLFTHQVPQHLKTILEKSLKKKSRGIIIDLRDNTGGALQSAVDCAGLFLPHNSLVVSTKNRQNTILNRYTTSSQPILEQALPIMILVNQFTASAAEILAKSLSIYSEKNTSAVSPYIFIVGTQTFGKGSIQEVRPIGSNCALKLTTALYYLSDGTSIQDKGVTPDIIIKQKYPASKELKELQRLYGSEKAPQPKKKNNPPYLDYESLRLKALTKDHQIVSTIHLIQLLDLGITTNPTLLDTHSKALTWLRNHSAFGQKLNPVALSSSE